VVLGHVRSPWPCAMFLVRCCHRAK
jgi:hypothetical protein